MLQINFQGDWPSAFGGEDFQCLYHIGAMWPPWSYDPDKIYKISFFLCLNAVYEI